MLKQLWSKIAAIAVGIVAILLYVLSLKQKKINALQAKAELVQTKEEADALENEINIIKANRGSTKKELDEASEAMLQLENRKAEIAKQQGNKTPSEVEDYWNK